MPNLANLTDEVTYRQTFNVYYKTWGVPKKKTIGPNGSIVWQNIKNLETLITKRDGIGFAIWRLRENMLKITYNNSDRKIWNCSDIKKVKRGRYSIFYLTCKRIKYGIYGAN